MSKNDDTTKTSYVNDDGGRTEVKSSESTGRTDIYTTPGGSSGEHGHDVINTAADGWTTHDYSRDADGNTFIDAPTGGGNVISGGEQYDE